MAPSTNVRAAIRRLEAAISAIEAAAGRVRHASDRDSELAIFAADRAKLAEELDAMSARAQRLEAANREVSRRLGQSADAIRDMLDAPE
ncbi:hypothetical protein GCM10007276_15430 [Agaricicola taiwanensis]|uniref:DUF4164 family protein n=1 Tax=Agaricicola taiwanensis TaxID=591372 RepID=A0A8J2VS82_9RHOB|nr:DUF4164 family protein [Agaricicola taiwanensis]GGE38998.1 hypothetical protein GCM10007276_15430 [Agaricicola taiwanensis]